MLGGVGWDNRVPASGGHIEVNNGSGSKFTNMA